MLLSDLPTPQVLIDQARSRRNIDRAQQLASNAGVALRPHAKTHKSPVVARWQLDADLDKKNFKKLLKADRKMPRAIVVDIDETVLDNSPSNAYTAKNNLPFNVKDWYAWGEMRKAKPIPGAVEFLNYAVSKGVKIFYISNRDEIQKQATIDNLRTVGFKDASTDNVWLRQNPPSPPRNLAGSP
jgi:5'-nucleotidase (lipoprotein e(P4) family)